MSGANHPGRSMWVGVGAQTAVGVAAAPTKFFEVSDISGILEEYDWKTSDKRVRSRFKALGRNVNMRVPIGFTVELNPQNAGLLLALAFGDDAVAADGAAYKHTASVTSVLKYFTVVVWTDGVADASGTDKCHQIINCKVNSAKIDGTMDEPLKLAIEATGTQRTAVLTSGFTPAFPTARPFYVKADAGYANIGVGAAIGTVADFDEANEFHFSITNGVALDRRIDGTAAASGIREGDSAITGNMKAVFNAETFTEMNIFRAGTDRALVFTATSVEEAAAGKPFLLVLSLDDIRYTGAPGSWDPDLMSVDIAFEGAKTTGYPKIMLTNADSAEYF